MATPMIFGGLSFLAVVGSLGYSATKYLYGGDDDQTVATLGPSQPPTPAQTTAPAKTPTPTPGPGPAPSPTPTPAQTTAPAKTPTPTPTPTHGPGTAPSPTPTPTPGPAPTIVNRTKDQTWRKKLNIEYKCISPEKPEVGCDNDRVSPTRYRVSLNDTDCPKRSFMYCYQ